MHPGRFAASFILRLMYGKSTPTSNDDPEVARIHQVMQNFEHVMRPGAYLVDRIPLLKYIPGYGRELKEFHNFEMKLFGEQMDRVRSEMVSINTLSSTALQFTSGIQGTGRCGNSFMRTLLEHADEHLLERDEMAYLAGSLFGAGSETVCPIQ